MPDGIDRPARTATPPATAWCRRRSPCPCRTGPKAEGAALQLANKMGIEPAMVVHSHAHRRRLHVLRRLRQREAPGRPRRRRTSRSAPTRCCRRRRSTARSRTGLHRELVVLGACIGTDAHTVGIDAILNVKGFAGEKGLEYYREMAVTNLGAQVTVPELVAARPRRPRRRRPRLPGGHAEGRPPAQHPRARRRLPRGDGGGPPAARRRRPALRPGDGRRPRRRQGLRPGDDARRGRQLPDPRPASPQKEHAA